MRNKITLLGLAMASALACGSVAVAAGPAGGSHGWHGHHGHHGQRGHGPMMMLGKLDLSDAQRAQIKQIVANSRNQDRPARKALHEQRKAFRAMTPDAAGYQSAAASLARAEGQATQERVQRMANLRAQIYGVLTPAQRSQLAADKAQKQARRQQWQQFKAEHPLPSTDK